MEQELRNKEQEQKLKNMIYGTGTKEQELGNNSRN